MTGLASLNNAPIPDFAMSFPDSPLSAALLIAPSTASCIVFSLASSASFLDSSSAKVAISKPSCAILKPRKWLLMNQKRTNS
jgi:hypothetical protein